MARDDENEQETPVGALTTQPRANQTARRDFSGNSLTVANSASDALVARARAEIEARCIMAMRNPRNLDDVRQDILLECRRPRFAEVATYARPVGKEKNKVTGQWEEKFAEGLSIRFAEVAMRCAGNMQCKAQVVYDGPDTRNIVVTALDYERNATWDVELTVSKTVERRELKRGQKPIGERANAFGDRLFIVIATDQEVAVKCAAEVSKASRTAILRLIPGHLQDEAFELCKKVAADQAAKDPDEARNRVLDAFSSIGVKPSALEQWLGHGTDTISPAEVEQLRKLYSGINDGEAVWSEALSERLADRDKPGKQADAKPSAPVEQNGKTADPVKAATATTTTTTTETGKPAESKPAETKPASSEPAKAKATSSGKGTSALKDKLKAEPPADPAQPSLTIVPDKPATSGPPPLTLTPVAAANYEMRDCAMCGAEIEVLKTDPTGGKCEACLNS